MEKIKMKEIFEGVYDCECGKIVANHWSYCPDCGKKLKGDD